MPIALITVQNNCFIKFKIKRIVTFQKLNVLFELGNRLRAQAVKHHKTWADIPATSQIIQFILPLSKFIDVGLQ